MIELSSQRVLVTGAHGFLGRYVTRELDRRGCREVLAPTHEECDLLDPVAIRTLLHRERPDVVIHLAARVGGIGANLAHPAEFVYDNLAMGIHLIHESWQHGVQKMVLLGTVCAYPKFTPVPFREVDLWNGYPEETNAPYGLAKKMLLVQSQAYRQQYGFNSIFLLPTNLYGPGDHIDPRESHVIPALIQRYIDAREAGAASVLAWGDGSPTREFLYAEDAARGIVMATQRYDSSEPVNLGSGVEISIRELTETIAEMVGYHGRTIWDTSRPNGQPRRLLDASRAREAFGFIAETTFREGLRRTVEWYQGTRPIATRETAAT